MHFITRNVNTAFEFMVKGFSERTLPSLAESSSRNGPVLMVSEPVLITYTHPRERVLFNQARDCNPFFHLYEALWMLAGRNDVAPLAYYNSNIANYSDDGQIFNGAYGYRWRHGKGQTRVVRTWQYEGITHNEYSNVYDQLRILIDHLKAVPDSRRAVLQMWNVEDDLLKIGSTCPRCGGPGCHVCDRGDGDYPGAGAYQQSKDVCCNTHVYFALRTEKTWMPIGGPEDFKHTYLDMTVCNRSNDLIWGALGANVVHFSFLQEYMATCIGVEVGVYNQITNNCHVYLNDKWQPEKWLADNTPDWYRTNDQPIPPLPGVRMFSLVKDPATFDQELTSFVGNNRQQFVGGSVPPDLVSDTFLRNVAQPMLNAFHAYKRKDFNAALAAIETVQADDWRIAGTNWLLKRKAAHEARTNKG